MATASRSRLDSKLYVLLLLLSLSLVNGAFIAKPNSGIYGRTSINKRAVIYAQKLSNPESSSVVCTKPQKDSLEQSMTESAKLAAAGSDALALIVDAMGPKTSWNKLSAVDKKRIGLTYTQFFGKLGANSDFPDNIKRINIIRNALERIRSKSIASWPDTITFFCDSTYYQDKDDSGKTWDQIPLAQPDSGKVWKFDWSETVWAQVNPQVDCSLSGKDVAAFTLPLPNIGVGPKSGDRITFCPAWFTITAGAGKSFTDLDPAKDIKVDTPLSDFTRKAGRIFLHEHLHSWTFTQLEKDADGIIRDVQIPDPNDPSKKIKAYGPVGMQTLAKPRDVNKPKAPQPLASKNVDSIVYWCIAMYYNTWDWHTLSAQKLSDQNA